MRFLTTFAMLILIAGIAACKKGKSPPANSNTNASTSSPDKTAPVITLKGEEQMTISLLSNAPDPGASATDDRDGDITQNVTSDWDIAIKQGETGVYVATYSAHDLAGNTATKTRTVIVALGASALTGLYTTMIETKNGMLGPVTTTVSVGSHPGQIVIYPYWATSLVAHVELEGILKNEFTISENHSGVVHNATGKILNNGATIVSEGTLVGPTTATSYTQTMTRQ